MTVDQGIAYQQTPSLRLMVRQEANCPLDDVSDVWWWRVGDDVCVWAESWPQAMALPALSSATWDRLDAGQGQWWVLDHEDGILAVFSLDGARRRG